MADPNPAIELVPGVSTRLSRDHLSKPQGQRVPLVIGITGHRDVRSQDLNRLERKVEALLVAFRRKYRSTPLAVLSPLANGADRVAARAALRLRNKHPRDIRLVVPLPMPRQLYALDFDSDSLKEFNQLLEQADAWFELPLAEGNTRDAIRHPGTARDRQYREVGKYVARYSQILVALWNGKDPGRVGGTADVVRLKVTGVEEMGTLAIDTHRKATSARLHRGVLEPAECGPVYQVVTPRSDHPGLVGKPLTWQRHYPPMFPSQAAAREYYTAMFSHVDDFNRDVAAADMGEELAGSRNDLLSPQQQELSPVSRALLEDYRVADMLAIRCANRLKSTQVWLHVWAGLALASFEVFAHLGKSLQPYWEYSVTRLLPSAWNPLEQMVQNTPVLLFIALLLYGVAFFVYQRVTSHKYQDRYQDYRALAEGLRVQFFWHLAGLTDRVADYYLGKHRTELDWIRNAIRNWTMLAESSSEPPRIDTVVEHWVRHQHSYFSESQDEKREKHIRLWVRSWLLAALIAGLVLLGWSIHTPHSTEKGWHVALVILVALSLIAAGLRQHYGEKMAFREHAKQYHRMKVLFAHALRRIEQAQDDYEKQCLIRELGISALEENGDWVLLHRERPLEVPHA